MAAGPRRVIGRGRHRVDPSTGGDPVAATFIRVSEPAAQAAEIVCPHCKKPFHGQLLAEGSRHQGFKCPHCRLFVPIGRTNAGDDEQ